MRKYFLFIISYIFIINIFLISCSDSELHVTGIHHATVNCSDYEQSRLFYEMFGFQSVNDFEENSPEVAEALGVSSYMVRGSYMTLNSKSIIELVDWEEPYDSELPYPHLYHIGVARIAILTTNIDADVRKLKANGVEFISEEPVYVEMDFWPVIIKSRFICSYDPDGTIVELVEWGNTQKENPSGMNTSRIMHLNTNVSDFDESKRFYNSIGFFTAMSGINPHGTPESANGTGMSYPYTLEGELMAVNLFDFLGSPILDLLEWKEPRDYSPPYGNQNHLGIARFAMATTDLDTDISILQSNGIELLSETPAIREGINGPMRFICFKDPDSIVVELVEN